MTAEKFPNSSYQSVMIRDVILIILTLEGFEAAVSMIWGT